MACCPRASSFVRHTEGREALAQEHLTVSALSAPCDGSPMTVRGGGVPARTTALMPLCRMGPPPRSSLPMRITASWSGSLARRIQGCGTIFRAPTRSSPRTSSSRPRKCAASCSEPSRTRAPLRAALCAILDRSCARRRSARVGRDEETGLPRSNNETGGRNNWMGPPGAPLTKITPYKVLGRLHDELLHARRRQASEKRQGTKSREADRRRCDGGGRSQLPDPAPQGDTEQELHAAHDSVAIADTKAGLDQMQLKPGMSRRRSPSRGNVAKLTQNGKRFTTHTLTAWEAVLG